MMEKPCKNCTRRNPLMCSGVGCREYHDWFVEAWDQARMRLIPFLPAEEEQNENTDESV